MNIYFGYDSRVYTSPTSTSKKRKRRFNLKLIEIRVITIPHHITCNKAHLLGERMLAGAEELAKLRAHDGESHEDDDMNKDKGKRGDAHEALDVHLDEPATSLPVEAPPGIHEADTSGTAEDLGHGLSAKGAVERHDGVLVFRQDGSLDADLGHDSRHAEEKSGGNGGYEDDCAAANEAGPLSGTVLGQIVVVRLLTESEQRHKTHGDAEGNVGHGSGNGGGKSENLPLLTAGDAAPETDIAGGGDNLVGPGSVEVRGGGTGGGGNEEVAERDESIDTREERLAKAHDPARCEGVDDLVAETPPASESAGLVDKVANSAANGRGDGLLVDEGNGGAGLKKTLLLVLGGRLVVVGDGDGGGGCFDHGEHGEDIGERVLHLVALSAGSHMQRIARAETYQADGYHRRDHGHGQKHGGPSVHLNLSRLQRTLEQRRTMLEAPTGDVVDHIWGWDKGNVIKRYTGSWCLVLRRSRGYKEGQKKEAEGVA